MISDRTRQLDEIAELREGWGPDGDGLAIGAAAVETARRFMDWWPVPCTDGSLQMEWHHGPFSIEIYVKPDGIISGILAESDDWIWCSEDDDPRRALSKKKQEEALVSVELSKPATQTYFPEDAVFLLRPNQQEVRVAITPERLDAYKELELVCCEFQNTIEANKGYLSPELRFRIYDALVTLTAKTPGETKGGEG